LNLYLANTGDDGDDGLSAGSAFATWGRVKQFMRSVDMRGNFLTVNVLPGNYEQTERGWYISAGDSCNASGILVQGTEPDSFPVIGGHNLSNNDGFGVGIDERPPFFSNAYNVFWHSMATCPVFLHRLHIANTSVGVNCACGKLVLGDMVFTDVSGYAVQSVFGGNIQVGQLNWLGRLANVVFEGTSSIILRAWYNGMIEISAAAIDFQDTACSTVFQADGHSAGWVQANATFTGTPTGKRYNVAYNSLLNTYGGGVNRIPGTIAGTVDDSSAYK
jgi:hypothetical protein